MRIRHFGAYLRLEKLGPPPITDLLSFLIFFDKAAAKIGS